MSPAHSPIDFADVAAARERLRDHLPVSPAMSYPLLDALVGHGIRVWVKHENHLPVNTFKVRNGTSALTALLARDEQAARRGVAAATTGNHGQGLAWAGARLGIPVTICVPLGNNPDKNASIRSYGARLIEHGAAYDDAIAACDALVDHEGLTRIHSTNNADVLAGAGTLTAEFLEQVPDLDAVVLALGGGSQCVGAITVRDAVRPSMAVYAVQSDGATAQYDGWRDGKPRSGQSVRTFAEGIATGATYEMTRDALRSGLADFVLVSDHAIAQAVRELLRVTHNLVEGSGAAGLAGLQQMAPRLTGKTVGIVLSGGNLDAARLQIILAGGTP
ncbi:MAG: threonine/serine dehydratase [Gemmatimonas sp.]